MPSNYQKKYLNRETTQLVFTGEMDTLVPTLPEAHGFSPDHEDMLIGADALSHLSEVLNALGLEVFFRECHTEQGNDFALMTIHHPTIDDARAIRTRNSGRKPKSTSPKSPLDDLTPQERLQWLYDHTPEEGCDALGGVSTRTRKRRIAELRRECQS